MDKLEYYRSTIKKILTEYYEMALKGSLMIDELDADHYLAFDEERDQYLWLRSGWDDTERIGHIVMYFRINNGKIWVEEDGTDLFVVDDLLEAEIPESDIVLGFHHPSQRALTVFARE